MAVGEGAAVGGGVVDSAVNEAGCAVGEGGLVGLGALVGGWVGKPAVGEGLAVEIAAVGEGMLELAWAMAMVGEGDGAAGDFFPPIRPQSEMGGTETMTSSNTTTMAKGTMRRRPAPKELPRGS